LIWAIGKSPHPRYFSSLNTELTEHLRDLRVKVFSGTEDTEEQMAREDIFTGGGGLRPPHPARLLMKCIGMRSTLSPKGERAGVSRQRMVPWVLPTAIHGLPLRGIRLATVRNDSN
jgi:hypothetical protein